MTEQRSNFNRSAEPVEARLSGQCPSTGALRQAQGYGKFTGENS